MILIRNTIRIVDNDFHYYIETEWGKFTVKTVLFNSMKWAAVVGLSATMLTACSGTSNTPAQNAQPTASAAPTTPAANTEKSGQANSWAEAYKTITDEMNKAKDGKPDYALVEKTYNEKFKAIAQKRDTENSETTDQHITAAITGAKSGQMNGMVAKQIVDKLLQNVMYTSMKAEFKEASSKWGKPDEVKKDIAEAKAFYAPVVEDMIKKRDSAFNTTMVDSIKIAFTDMEKAAGDKTTLNFDLSRQVVDKTIMKAFYLAIGAKDLGYAYKVEKAVKEGKDPKVEQAETWAFFQSISKYIAGQSKEDAEFVNKQFELATDTKTVKGDAVNAALVRGLAKVALHEYDESHKDWGKDKAVITSLEGALFIDMIAQDITKIKGEATYKTLKEQAEKHLNATKEGKKDVAEATLKQIQTVLNEVIQQVK